MFFGTLARLTTLRKNEYGSLSHPLISLRMMVDFVMVDFVELLHKLTNSVRTIEELSVEFVLQTFKRYFQNFLQKANQQFVEILMTTYIFQSYMQYL